jgi:hypothetical protein
MSDDQAEAFRQSVIDAARFEVCITHAREQIAANPKRVRASLIEATRRVVRYAHGQNGKLKR